MAVPLAAIPAGPRPCAALEDFPGEALVPRVRGDHPTPDPHVIVLFGATGDLARRKLLPGLFHLSRAGLLPECRIVATSLEDLDDDEYHVAGPRRPATSSPGARWPTTTGTSSAHASPTYPRPTGPAGLARAVEHARRPSSAASPAGCTT